MEQRSVSKVSVAFVFFQTIVMASIPFRVEPPRSPQAGRRESYKSVTIDQLISRVMKTHEDKPWMKSTETASLLMSGDSGMIMAELDMMLTQEQFSKLYSSPDRQNENRGKGSHRQKRKVYQPAKPWRNNEVPYVLNPWDFTGNERAVIHLAMQEWEQHTCIKFRPSNTSDKDKLIFQNGIGCNSQLGQAGGSQALNLEAPGCRFKGLYLHEIGHALGLVHEHQLPNRDSYIDILWDNVKPEWKQWFDKYSSNEFSSTADVPYDLSSVMHYGITAFSYDDESQTIQAIDEKKQDTIGRVYKKELSFNDIKTVNTMYRCNVHCSDDIRCGGEGYVDKDCMCSCPGGGNGCQLSPPIPPIPTVSCQNTHESEAECDKWAADDQCSLNPLWMLENCRSSCKKCDTAGGTLIPDKACENSYDDDEDCDMYASAGECFANPAWMYHNCKASCGWCKSSSACRDLYADVTQCQEWKGYGYCDRNPAWMWANCRSTCNVCTNPPEGCENKAGDDICYADASVGECQENSDYMNENCAMSCGKCGSCYNEFPDDSVCIDLAASGECTLSPEWMGRYCKKACDACDGHGLPIGEARPCSDKDSRCQNWAKQDECELNPSWMIPNCQKSCDKCDCVNLHGDEDCDMWVESGQCESNTPWMSENCQKACRYCTNLPPPPDRCSNKYSKDLTKCDKWASEGECFKNPLFMIPQCRASCTKCGEKQVCEKWSDWSSWTGCSRTCGTGMRSRTRRCQDDSGVTQDEMIGCMMSECVTTTVITTTSRPSTGTVQPRVRPTTTPTIKTMTTTTPSPDCRNKHQRGTECDTWAKYGHCQTNPSWMHDNCALSCEICNSNVECVNSYGDDEQCNAWADYDQCAENPGYMLKNCAKACNQCENIVTPTTTTTQTLPTNCVNLHSSNSACDSWAEAGHCRKNSEFMHVRCARSCRTCGSVTTTESPITENPSVSTTMKVITAATRTTTPGTVPSECSDKHESCSSWASSSSRDYCTSSMYVRDNCKISCSLCTTPLLKESGVISTDDCYDRSTDCISWAFEGRCISQAQQMKDRCPLSCEYCRPALCVNIDANCYRWAETQACHIFPKLMAKKCRLACGYCSNNGLTCPNPYLYCEGEREKVFATCGCCLQCGKLEGERCSSHEEPCNPDLICDPRNRNTIQRFFFQGICVSK